MGDVRGWTPIAAKSFAGTEIHLKAWRLRCPGSSRALRYRLFSCRGRNFPVRRGDKQKSVEWYWQTDLCVTQFTLMRKINIKAAALV
jgi:hypothetical protein